MKINEFDIFIKTYESDNSIKPKIGDYAHIFNESDDVENLFHDFFKKNIGQIIKINKAKYDMPKNYTVKFENVPDKLKSGNKYYDHALKPIDGNNATWFVIDNDIMDFAPTIEELKSKIAARKYNL